MIGFIDNTANKSIYEANLKYMLCISLLGPSHIQC